MNKYIGFKSVQAAAEEKDGKEGYTVVYSDGYVSWSPKDVFEKAYMMVGDNNTITSVNVEQFIKTIEVIDSRPKTTIVKATLVNGFVIVESSSCVDPENYNVDFGKEICVEKIKIQIWELLGFILHTAKNGIK